MFKKAFTMIELIMVIVVLGIVASIGADIIANLYENYIKTRAINSLQTQTELVLDQIQKRLTYRIKDSVIARNSTDYITLSSADSNYSILEWIGKDNESFKGISNPGWSGFIDLESNDTNKTSNTLKTSGSELNTTSDIIKALSYDTVSLLDTDIAPAYDRPTIILKGLSGFDMSNYGWDNGDGNYTLKVSYTASDTDILNFDENITAKGVIEISEQYDLAWSAYALVPEGDENDFNLTLYYNYQPWEGEQYDDNITANPNIKKATIMEHVSTFRFTQIGETIRIKLCINDANRSGDYNFGFCKERVIF